MAIHDDAITCLSGWVRIMKSNEARETDTDEARERGGRIERIEASIEALTAENARLAKKGI